MKKLNLSWGIKNSRGRLSGPFSTQQIIKMINDGQFTGDEQISRLPGSQWNLISSEPEFFDFFLKKLEKENQPSSPEPDLNKTVLNKPKAHLKNEKPPDQKSTNTSIQNNNSFEETALYPMSIPLENNAEPKNSEVIELVNIEGHKNSALLKNNRKLIFTFTTLIFIVLFLVLSTKPKVTKIHLLEPKQQHGSALSPEELKYKIAQSVVAIADYTFESYLKAQNILVSSLESNPNNLDARVLLCLVHKELWPYSYQDAKDIQTLNNVVMVSRKSGGQNTIQSRLCEVSRLIALGRINEAKGELQSISKNHGENSNISNDELRILSYLFNAELLEIEKNFLYAKSYYEQFISALPTWIKPHVALARIYYEENQNPKGYEYLKIALKINPNHKPSLILMGLYEYKYNRTENAYRFLESAVRQNSLIDNRLEAQGLVIISKILLAKGDKKKALEYAQRGYNLDFGNQEIKSILSRLNQKIEDKNPEQKSQYFEFLGDEFFRKEDFLSAQAEYKTAFELFPKRGLLAHKAAKSLWKIHQSGDAIYWLEKAIKAEPQYISAYITLSDY
ncbi:MAG TPA: hypothetical protein PLJ21_04675, partial [Pseudobdellovibrionaceae bacterium]|nr:hypothetical protein [Pseudobdellovibrionaceae bacterium]